MANDLSNFIPEIWSKKLQKHYDNKTVFKKLVNTNYEGDIKMAGDTVKVRYTGDITINDYTKNSKLVFEDLTSGLDTMLIDQFKSFAFKVDDIDRVQMDINALEEYTKRAGIALALDTDQYLHSHYADVASANTLNTTGTAYTLSTSNIYGYILDLRQLLEESNANMDRHLVINPAIENILLETPEFIHATQRGDERITSGHIGRIAGFNIHVSNNLNTVSNTVPILALTPDFISFAQQINKVKAVEPEDEFSKGVKGLNVYGSKVFSQHNKQAALMYASNL